MVHVAPYSAMSGVAEIKTILGGFIIKQFLGAKTLIVKCISLVSILVIVVNVYFLK